MRLKEAVHSHPSDERAAYLLCGQADVESDVWLQAPFCRLVSNEVIEISESEIISASSEHITWSTESFVRLMGECRKKGLVLGVVHSHSEGCNFFSKRDDENESELYSLLAKRNGPDSRLLSVVITRDGGILARVWEHGEVIDVDRIFVGGDRFQLITGQRKPSKSPQFLHRQALALGDEFTKILSHLHVGVIGAGGTGSAVCNLLPRLGVRHLAIIDGDIVEETNMNRLHGATMQDVRKGNFKTELLVRHIKSMGLGVNVVSVPRWIGSPECREILKSCDLIFGCTDDHNGRSLINRYAYFYNTPLIDMGLAIKLRQDTDPPAVETFDARVTVVQPGTSCLLCREVVDPIIARDQALREVDPEEYERRKKEAYVIGEGNPSPAVVTFTTSVACMAIEEMIHRFQGFRGSGGSINNRLHKYHLLADRRLGTTTEADCPLCGTATHWGRGDMKPFLNRIG